MRFDKHILSIGLPIIALAWSLWYVFAGMGNHMDPLYWLHKYEFMEGGWMAVGTILFGGAVVRLFGAGLLAMRWVAWLCVTVAIALPYCCLLDRDQRKANLHWLALAFGLMGYGAFQELSPGTLTVLLLSVMAVLAIQYRRAPGNIYLVVLGSIAGLAITVRFPNILALPIVLGLTGVVRGRQWWRDSMIVISSALLSAAFVYGMAWLWLTPAPMDAAMNSHQLMKMLSAMWTKGALLIGYALLWTGIGCLPVALPESWKEKNRVLPLAGVMVGLAVLYYALYVPSPRQWYNIDLTYMIAAGVLMMAFAGKQREEFWMAALLIVAALGTDVGWLKLFPAVLVLLPVAGATMPQEKQRYLWPVVLGLTIAVMIRFSTNSVGGSDLRKSREVATAMPYTGIRVTEQETEYMMQIKADYDSLSAERSILAVGSDLHLMRSLTGCEAARYNEFWSNIFDSVYTAKYQPIIETEHPIIFCFFSPQFRTKPTYRNRHSAFEDMLRAQGYEAIDRGKYKYMIYTFQEDGK